MGKCFGSTLWVFKNCCVYRPSEIHKFYCGKRSLKHKYQNLLLISFEHFGILWNGCSGPNITEFSFLLLLFSSSSSLLFYCKWSYDIVYDIWYDIWSSGIGYESHFGPLIELRTRNKLSLSSGTCSGSVMNINCRCWVSVIREDILCYCISFFRPF